MSSPILHLSSVDLVAFSKQSACKGPSFVLDWLCTLCWGPHYHLFEWRNVHCTVPCWPPRSALLGQFYSANAARTTVHWTGWYECFCQGLDFNDNLRESEYLNLLHFPSGLVTIPHKHGPSHNHIREGVVCPTSKDSSNRKIPLPTTPRGHVFPTRTKDLDIQSNFQQAEQSLSPFGQSQLQKRGWGLQKVLSSRCYKASA